MKKIGIGIGIFILLVLAAIVITPMVYDINKLRPQIIAAIEENLNAKAEVGKLSLSLWGGIYVGVDELKLTETVTNTEVFEMKGAKISVPFSTIFGGHIDATIFANAPTINLIKDKAGKLNAMNMVKPATEKAQAPAAPGKASNAGSLAGKFSLSTRITDAKLVYKDLLTNSASTIDKLDLNLSDVGIGTPMKIDVKADLALTQGKDIEVRGPLVMKGSAKVEPIAGGAMQTSLEATVELDAVKVRYGALFDKEPKVPLRIDLKLQVLPDQIKIEKFDLVANDLKINTVMTVSNLNAPAPTIDLKLTSNELELSRWRPIIAPVKQFDMAGKVGLNVSANGPTDKLNFGGSVKLKDVSLRSAGVVPRIEHVNSELLFSMDTASLKNTSLQIGSSDIELNGTVQNFKAPIIRVAMSSKKLNVDEIQGASAPVKADAPDGAAAAKQVSPEERDRQLEAMAKGPIDAIKASPVMRNLDFAATAKINQIIVHKAQLQEMNAEMSFAKLVMAIKNARLKLYSGTAEAKMAIDFNGADPAYKMSGTVKAVDIDEAMANQMPDFKGFITGKANATFDMNGSGVTVAKAKKTLKGAGKYDIQSGTWSGLVAVKMIAEKLKSIPQIKDKASALSIGNKFKTFNGVFNILSGKINLTSANMELEEAHTSIKMAGWVDFDKMMDMTGTIEAPMADVPPKLRAADGRAKLPFEIAGLATKPDMKYEVTLKPVAAAYFESEGKKALGNLLQKKADELGHGDQVKGLLKGLGL